MRAVVKRSFLDLREKRAREEGEVFELTEDRFKEINRKLNGYIVETDEEATEPVQEAEPQPEPEAKAKRRTASTKAKKPADK